MRYNPHWSENPAHYLFEIPRAPFVFLTRTSFVVGACRNHVVDRVAMEVFWREEAIICCEIRAIICREMRAIILTAAEQLLSVVEQARLLSVAEQVRFSNVVEQVRFSNVAEQARFWNVAEQARLLSVAESK